MHGIALAQRLPADSSAPRTADRLLQQLGCRMYANRGRAADTFPYAGSRPPDLYIGGFVELGMRVVPAVAPAFQLLVLPAGVPAPPKLVLAGSHCFLLVPIRIRPGSGSGRAGTPGAGAMDIVNRCIGGGMVWVSYIQCANQPSVKKSKPSIYKQAGRRRRARRSMLQCYSSN